MRLIFLDVDGVLNHDGIYGIIPARIYRTLFGRHQVDIDPARVARIKRIMDETDAHIVVSSSWRKNPAELKSLLEMLAAGGITGSKVIGCTPFMKEALKELGLNKHMKLIAPRGLEIHAYLTSRDDVESFVILDDNSIVFRGVAGEKLIKYLSPRFVKTKARTGITEADVDKSINLLLHDRRLFLPGESDGRHQATG